ncbi:sodium- and chloride-dependent glycine transporter 2-like [Gordionus sp. m RMFG-2023]|uniref:sodium- and chloride-dependent glycine transporter 2-like n=1 Tax=Gordionus sp. m RMFG-2023 TaxID=3053472 RepID=UPI0031FDA792
MFFSLSVTMGGLMTLASYIPFNNNCYKDSILVSLLDTGTSLMAGFVIFSVLGFMSNLKHTTLDKVVAGGTGLAFIVYPEALSQLPLPQFWSFIFFIMLYTLGIDSQITFIETVQAALHDQFPKKFPRKNKSLVCGTLCFMFFILGFPCVTRDMKNLPKIYLICWDMNYHTRNIGKYHGHISHQVD